MRPAGRREVLEAARRADAVVAPWVPPYLYAGLPARRTLFVADMYNPADVEHGGGTGVGSRLRLASMRANDRLQLRFAMVNGELGCVAYEGDELQAVLLLDVQDGQICHVFVVANPAKLAHCS